MTYISYVPKQTQQCQRTQPLFFIQGLTETSFYINGMWSENFGFRL